MNSYLKALLNKYPKYCPKCKAYFPGAYLECKECKEKLVSSRWINDMQNLKRILGLAFLVVIIAIGLYAVNKKYHHIVVNVLNGKYTIANQAKVINGRSIRDANIIVVDFISGNSVIGTVLKEDKNYILFRSIDQSIEVTIMRNKIKSIRKPTEQEVEEARIQIPQAEARNAQKNIENERYEMQRKITANEKYRREVESARRANLELDSKLQREKREEEEKLRMKKEGIIPDGMSQNDVQDMLGSPDKKNTFYRSDIDKRLDRKTEVWIYGNDYIYFRDGKVIERGRKDR